MKPFPLLVLFACGVVSCLAGCGPSYLPDPRANTAQVEAIRKNLLAASSSSATTDPAAPAATGTGWGTLKGRFVFEGSVPAPRTLVCDKDQGTCCKEALIDESLVVGSDGGIQNIIVFMRNNPTRVHADFEQLAATPAVLDNVKCVFRPHVLTVWTKQKLLLKNSDNVGHNTNFTSAKQGFNASLAAGVEQDRTFKYSESSPSSVSCNIHPWMAAKMLIRDNPYFAVTKADGSFEIPNMPAGEKIEIQLWHELNPQLEMQANDAKIAKGRFTLTLAENETKTLELKLNSTLLPIK